MGRWVYLVAWDASFSVEYVILGSFADRAYWDIAELDTALYQATVDRYFWHEIYRSFCLRDSTTAVCRR